MPLQAEQPVRGSSRTYDVVEALGGTQTRWAHADNENINVAVEFAW